MDEDRIQRTALRLAYRRGLVVEDPTTAAVTSSRALDACLETGLLDLESANRLRAEAEALVEGTDDAEEVPALGLFPVRDQSRYRPELFLGDGGMGRVFLAHDQLLNRRVALKFFRTSLPREVQIFRREAQSQARIDHPHVAKVFEAGELEGIPYLSMQYIQGPTLARAVEQLSLRERVELVRQASLGVHAGHRLGIVHRDVKPGNIMLERDPQGVWQAYVMDFGLARDLSDPEALPSTTVMGTPAFMAPEQIQGPAVLVGPHTDVYALGVTLYQMGTGRLPFPGANHAEVFRKVVELDPPSIRALDPTFPRDLESIIQRCMEKDVLRRYDSAQDLAEDLERFLSGVPVMARPVGVWHRWGRWLKRNPWAAAASLAVILLGGGWAGYALRNRARLAALGRSMDSQREALAVATAQLSQLRQDQAAERDRATRLQALVAQAQSPKEREEVEAQLKASRLRELELAQRVQQAERRLPDHPPGASPERAPEESKRPAAPVDVPARPAPRVEPEVPAPTPPRLLTQGLVPYPRQARINPNNPNLSRTVEVLVQVQVDAHGKVQDVAVLQGVPGGYDEAAKQAMRASTFAPATQGGQPVAGSLQVKVGFPKVR